MRPAFDGERPKYVAPGERLVLRCVGVGDGSTIGREWKFRTWDDLIDHVAEYDKPMHNTQILIRSRSNG